MGLPGFSTLTANSRTAFNRIMAEFSDVSVQRLRTFGYRHKLDPIVSDEAVDCNLLSFLSSYVIHFVLVLCNVVGNAEIALTPTPI
jgi:hypothetical protein